MTFFAILLAACGLVSGAGDPSASCADEAAHLQMDGATVKEDLHPRRGHRGHRERFHRYYGDEEEEEDVSKVLGDQFFFMHFVCFCWIRFCSDLAPGADLQDLQWQ